MNKENKPKGKLDHIVMGIILGGAVGSVLGLTLAPRKGKETREIIKQKGQQLIEKGKVVGDKFIKNNKETWEGAKYQVKKGRGFFRWLFGKKTKTEMPKVSMEDYDKK